MLHKKRVLTATYFAMRRRARVALGRPPRKRPPPILSQPLEAIVERHTGIIRSALANMPAGLSLTGKNACEVGSGDCLAAISFFLGLGARHVDVFEMSDPLVNEKQVEVLNRIKAHGLPADVNMIRGGPNYELDTQRVQFHKCYMEQFKGEALVDFLFSFSVLEHVEDLDGFFGASFRIMSPGSYMVHIIDLGGHSEFEDPMPPLDFQTYPDWLFDLMYPPYYRATRRFVSDYRAAAERHGFKIIDVKPVRTASPEYVDKIWSKLRPQARSHPHSEVGVIEFALIARKDA
jgi:hypothetical protein